MLSLALWVVLGWGGKGAKGAKGAKAGVGGCGGVRRLRGKSQSIPGRLGTTVVRARAPVQLNKRLSASGWVGSPARVRAAPTIGRFRCKTRWTAGPDSQWFGGWLGVLRRVTVFEP